MKFSFLLILLLSSDVWAKWSVSTYNIRNFDNDRGAGRTNLEALGKILTGSKSDVMAFEEIVNVAAFDKLISTFLPGYQTELSSCGGFGKQNLAIAFNPNLFRLVSQTEDRTFSGSDNGACGSLRPVYLVTLEHKANRTMHTFALVHLKAGSDQRALGTRWQQYEGLKRLARKYDNQNLILLGDFNTTGYIHRDEDYTRFEAFMSSSKLRSTTENIGCTNYWSGNQGGDQYQPSILDHIVIQDKAISSVESITVGAHCAQQECRPARPAELGVSFEGVSDHCPLKVSFK
ncbi:MAG TPA: endonuclease/exonuclease/phosphatase family protein [Bacteriovoracaceae bacterium]|nr:endonuclease/exonuclease/phosphatase family protein [Bacteriovoracaceae bacterium]